MSILSKDKCAFAEADGQRICNLMFQGPLQPSWLADRHWHALQGFHSLETDTWGESFDLILGQVISRINATNGLSGGFERLTGPKLGSGSRIRIGPS
jgi:hypothetical protein